MTAGKNDLRMQHNWTTAHCVTQKENILLTQAKQQLESERQRFGGVAGVWLQYYTVT